MYQEQPLESKKYLIRSLEEQVETLRATRNRLALRHFGTFLIGLSLIALALFAAQQLPNWLPAVEAYLKPFESSLTF